jgi:hypothetical protein
MTLQINMRPGQSAQGGPGVGLMTAAGNPWSLSDGLAQELVNRGVATPVNWPASVELTLTAAEVGSFRSLVSAAGNLTINSRDGLGRVTSYTDNSGTTYTVTYGNFGPATISGGGNIRTYNYNAQGLCTGYTGA